MGYSLLWLELLLGELLLLATLVALIGRIQRRRLRAWLLVALVIVALAAYAGLVLVVEWAKVKRLAPEGWGNPAWLLAILLAAGAVLIPLIGMRRKGPDRATPTAARWPVAKLAVALLVMLALNMMTFWNLDAAVQQRVEALRVEAGALALSVAPPRVPDRDNAAMIYDQAFELMGPEEEWDERWNEEWTEWLSPGGDEFDSQDSDVQKFLEDESPVLPVLRGVVKKPACYFRHDYARPSVMTTLPELSRIRRAARLLALDARSRAAAGDFTTAVDDVDALFVMGEHAGTVPDFVGMLVGGAVDELAVHTLEDVLASGQAPAEEVARIQVSTSVSYGRLLDRAIVMEEALGLSSFYEYGAWLDLGSLTGDEFSSGEEQLCSALAPFYRVFLLDDDAADYRARMVAAEAIAARPFYEVAKQWETLEERAASELRGLITNLMVPAMTRAARHAARFDAQRRLAQLAQAVAFHRASTGELPDDLDAWAATVRPDPFDGKPLKWKSTDTAIVLYSIGPDLTDDGGQFYEPDYRTGDVIFTLPR